MLDTYLKPFYTYLWLREDGTPYYVGKGRERRAFRKGSPPRERILIQEWLSESEAFIAESLLISLYGRKDLGTGILRNRTFGGEGTSGRRVSEQTKLKTSASLSNRKNEYTLERRQRMSQGRKGVTHETSQATRDKISKAKKGHRRTPEQCRRIREARWGVK